MMMKEKKIKVGDRVRVKGRTCISTVMYMKDGWVSVDTPIRTAESYPEDDVEYVDPRTAFLHDLKSVLEKHNAEIDVDFDDYGGKMLYFNVDGSEIELYRINSADANVEFPISANNIMDYK